MGVVRLILALAVVLGHTGYVGVIINSALAVQTFFIVSGFYMSLILSGDRYSSKSLFYSNRLLRLFPSYLAVLLASLAFVALAGKNHVIDWQTLTTLPDLSTTVVLAFANIFIIGQDVLVWFDVSNAGALVPAAGGLPAWKFMLVPQAWSIALELMFYALAPILVMLKTRTLVAIAIASLAVRLTGNVTDVPYELWPRRLFPAELCLFLLGMLSHRAMSRLPEVPQWAGAATLLAVVLFIVAHPHLGIDTRTSWALLYACIAMSLPVLFLAFRKSEMDRAIGELSYPVYLVHFLLIAVVDTIGIEWRLTAVLTLTLAASCAIYLCIDRPLSRLRHARLKHSGDGHSIAGSSPINTSTVG